MSSGRRERRVFRGGSSAEEEEGVVLAKKREAQGEELHGTCTNFSHVFFFCISDVHTSAIIRKYVIAYNTPELSVFLKMPLTSPSSSSSSSSSSSFS